MLVKIFNRGKGTGDAPVNYLLGDKFIASGMDVNELRNGARIVSGNPLVTQEMINSSNFSKRYTSGVLSFEEAPNEVSEADKQVIIADFEKMLFPGMNPDRTNFLWVEHTDKLHPDTGKPRLELNFVIPTTELYSGKRLQPYFHAQDKKYSDAWQTLINNSFALSDPHDVTKRRLVNPFDSNQSPKKSAPQLKADIENYIRVQMEAGLIKNRQDVISHLELIPDLAIKVTRQTPKSLSVISEYNQKPIRLKGFVFDENFDFDVYQAQMQPVNPETLNPNTSGQNKIETQTSKQQRVDQALLDFNAIYLHKAKYNQKKYAISEEEVGWVMQNYAPRFFDKAVLSEQNILAENQPNVERGLATEAIDESFDDTKIQPAAELPVESPLSSENSIVEMVIETSGGNQIISDLLSPQNEVSKNGDEIADDPLEVEMALANIQQEKSILAEKERLRLEQQRLDDKRNFKLQQERIKKERAKRQQEEQNRLLLIAPQMQKALDYSYRAGPEAYDLGYDKLRTLIKDNFVLALNQKTSGYFDALRLGIGRFSNKFHVTQDGRMGIDYSPYSNVSDFKYFYSSDLLELKEDKLYIKNTNQYYEWSRFDQQQQELLQESLKNSETNKADFYSQPAGLEGTFITYSVDLKTLPSHDSTTQPINESGLEGAFVTYSADLKVLPTSDSADSPKEPDLEGDDNENGPRF